MGKEDDVSVEIGFAQTERDYPTVVGRPWYAQYPDDYERKTSHLTMVQHGAYRLLLDQYYKTGRPLPPDVPTLQRMCRASAMQEKQAISSVLAEFFTLENDGWHNKRADEELQKAAELSTKRAQAVNKRYYKPPTIVEQLNTHSTATVTTTEKEKEKNPKKEAAHASRSLLNGSKELFEAFYQTYPLHKARRAAEKAYISALKRAAPEVILAGAKRYADDPARKPDFTKHPATWLTADGWLDETEITPETSTDLALKRIQELEKNGA